MTTTKRTDAELLALLDGLTERQMARLSVLAADQAGLSDAYQTELRLQLDACASCVDEELTDAEQIEALVRTDYDNEPELVFEGYRGAHAALRILESWRVNDRGARRLIDRLTLTVASTMYLAAWDAVHAESEQTESEPA